MENAIAVVGLYAGLNTLILLWIAASTGKLRAKHKVSIGDGGVLHLTRILRGHANAMENVPMALILMLVMAGLQTPVFVLHGFGIVLTIGRFCHAMHFIKEDAPGWQRALGATTSMLVLGLGALGVIGHAVVRLI
ncbi:MAG: MAPEG family protein [Micropepsaceae bacterium]